MKTIILASCLMVTPLLASADGCELLGETKSIGTEIYITDGEGVGYEMLCANVAEIHYVDGKAKVKNTKPQWAERITNDLGDDCW